MSAEKFFNSHSIEEISKKTKISPISLTLIKNKEFDKIPKVKFLGFIKIIENTYNIDLSDLIEEYNNQTQNSREKKTKKITKKEPKNQNSTLLITVLAFFLIIIGAISLLKNSPSKTDKIPKTNQSILLTKNMKPVNMNANELNRSNIFQKDKNITTTKKLIKNQKFPVIIIPTKKVWFKALNIDTNKSVEYLTSHQKILPKGNYYLKFGNINFKIIYNNQTIIPKVKRITRILLKNGTYKYLKKPNRYEK